MGRGEKVKVAILETFGREGKHVVGHNHLQRS